MSDTDLKKRFVAAFPWWTEGAARLGWTLEVRYRPGIEEVRRGGLLLGLIHNPDKDEGKFSLHMPGATPEQWDAVNAWLETELGPARPTTADRREIP